MMSKNWFCEWTWVGFLIGIHVSFCCHKWKANDHRFPEKKNDEGRKRSNWWVTWTSNFFPSNFGMVIPGDFFSDEVNSRNSEELMIERIYQSIKQWRMVAYHFPKWCLQPAGDDCVARAARWWHGGCPWNHQKLWNSYTWDIRDKVRLVFTS